MVLCRLAVEVQGRSVKVQGRSVEVLGRSVDSLIELDKAVIHHWLVCCENR